jgi:IS30 family transposase
MTTEAIDTSDLASPLYDALVAMLPAYVKEPFSASPQLNIRKLHLAIEMSHEAVYRWLRAKRINPRNAQKLLDLASQPENLSALKKLGRKPPKIEDFAPFYLA